MQVFRFSFQLIQAEVNQLTIAAYFITMKYDSNPSYAPTKFLNKWPHFNS